MGKLSHGKMANLHHFHRELEVKAKKILTALAILANQTRTISESIGLRIFAQILRIVCKYNSKT